MALLSVLPQNSVGAEIGVSSGVFSQVIVNTLQPRELYLIDPWDLLAEALAGTPDAGKWFADAEGMSRRHKEVVALFADNPSVRVIRGFSQEKMLDFEDDYFDWTYLDAHHRYDDVLKELRLSARKVRVGGFITGDDLFKEHDKKAEVSLAVQDWLAECGLQTHIDVLDRDAMPNQVTKPSRVGQQFIMPVTAQIKQGSQSEA